MYGFLKILYEFSKHGMNFSSNVWVLQVFVWVFIALYGVQDTCVGFSKLIYEFTEKCMGSQSNMNGFSNSMYGFLVAYILSNIFCFISLVNHFFFLELRIKDKNY